MSGTGNLPVTPQIHIESSEFLMYPSVITTDEKGNAFNDFPTIGETIHVGPKWQHRAHSEHLRRLRLP